MAENLNFIQGRKEQYNPSEMQGGLFFSKDSKEILLNGDSYGNATPADEEDITAESGNLKLKDRAYDEASFSGKGYVILRKNIQEITVPKFDLTITSGCTTNGTITIDNTKIEVTPELSTPEDIVERLSRLISFLSISGNVITFSSNPTIDFSTTGVSGNVVDNSYQENRNVLTRDMINKTNTIYEIRYDFDLNNAQIPLPKDCILNFTGGSLQNGKIVVQGCTTINSGLYNIFKNITFQQPYDYNSFIQIFYDDWADDIFKSKAFRVVKQMIITKDQNAKNIKDIDSGSNLYGDVCIIGNGHTFTFDTSYWPVAQRGWSAGTGGFLATKKLYIENLSIITNNVNQLQGFGTIFNSGQVELHNVYAYTYDRLAVDWSNDGYSQEFDSYLKLDNCRLFTTSFLFEGPYDQVDIVDSHLELLYQIRADYMFDVLSIGAADKSHKAYAKIKNSTIIGGWELVGSNESGTYNNGTDNYQTMEFINCYLKYSKVSWQSTTFQEERTMKIIYRDCYIEKDVGNPITNGIKSIEYNNCYFFLPNAGLYSGDAAFVIYQLDQLSFLNCTFVHDNRNHNTSGWPITSFAYPLVRLHDNGNKDCIIVFEGCKVRAELTWQFIDVPSDYNITDKLFIKNCELTPYNCIEYPQSSPNIYTYNNYALYLYLTNGDGTSYILPFNNTILDYNKLNRNKIPRLYSFEILYRPYASLFTYYKIKYSYQLDSIIGNTLVTNKILEI